MSNTYTLGIVFISGAGLADWIWDDVRAGLDLPSMAVAYAAPKPATLEGYVAAAMEQIEQFEAGRIVIVAHSIGGVIGLELARKLQGRAVGFVGVCAVIPAPGHSFLSVFPLPQRLVMRVIMQAAGTRPPDSVIRNSLCSGLPPDQASRVVDSFAAESLALYTDPVGAYDQSIPKVVYIRTTEDKELPGELQVKMAGRFQYAEIVDMQSGHMPMLNHADMVIGHINGFVANLR